MNNLSKLLASSALRQVSLTLLGLFSPIYIYQSFGSLNISVPTAISIMVFFYVILLLAKLIVLYIAENLSQRIGFKGTIWLSLIPFAVFVPALIIANSLLWLFVVSAIAWGLHEGFFWWGYHGFFIKSSDHKHFGKNLGKADLFLTLATVITPFIGALITAGLGFNFLFLVSFVFMLASLVVIGRKNDKKQTHDVRFGKVMGLIVKHRSVSISYAARGGENMFYGVYWPLFVFFIFGNVLNLGIIVSLAALVASVFAVVVGKLTDLKGEKWALKIGTPLTAISWMIRFIGSVPIYVLADSIRNFGQKL